ncbi:hypothetical protein AX16_002107 [Volvariella volvacea WC 439]|nr:hypothetical protein AX16_002107 [Volvariella volvacea WC 439]
MALLIDLPTKFLLQISTYVQEVSSGGAEHFHLAQLCKRLNLVLIPVILSSTGLADLSPTANVSLTKQPNAHGFDILSVLAIAFEIRTLPRLICRFQAYKFQEVLYHCYRIYLLIARLDVLEELELCFVDQGGFEPGGHYATQLQDWIGIFCGLLNAAVKKKCRKITITGGTIMTWAYAFWDYYSDAGICHYIFRRMMINGLTVFRRKPGLQAGPMGLYTRVDNGRTIIPTLNSAPPPSLCSPFTPPHAQSPFSRLRPKALGGSSLTSIEIGSCMLLKPPFSQWLYDIFRFSPNLTSLILKGVNGGLGWDWEPAIGILATCVPRSRPLQSLSIGQLTPPLDNFALFNLLDLLDLSNLTHLHLDETMPVFNLPENFSVLHSLPRIKIIHAPFDYFAPLMHEFDRLETARIIARFKGANYLDIPNSQLILDHLPLEFTGSFYDLTQAPSIAPFPSYFDARIHMVEQEELARPGPIRFYAGVTELALRSFAVWADRLQFVLQDANGTVRIKEDLLLYMVAWLGGFGDLHHIEFRSEDRLDNVSLMQAADRFAKLLFERCRGRV